MVSIITPSYNCGRFIEATIRSVQAQTYTDWEMLVVDDCSTDDSLAKVKPFADSDSRIRLIRMDKNSGAAICRNRALREAKGRWVAFLDSDDLWMPEKLERQVAFMKANGYAFTYHEYDEIDEQDRPLGVHVSGKRKVNCLDMFSCCWPGCLTVMYDREKIGLIQVNDIKKDNDSAMWLKAVRKAPCYLLPENLALYRRREGSVTPTNIVTKIKWHYHLFRIAEEMNPVSAFFWMAMNIPGNGFKKLFYVTKKKENK